MKQALSARYGGLLVDAHECDYTSFKHLHLLCPNCKKSVFLVGEKQLPAHTRKIKKDGEEKIVQVKGSEVGSYFAHHPDVSASAVEACELRVRNMSESEKLAIKAQSKRQLVKVLHSHFYKILRSAFNLKFHELDIYAMRKFWDEYHSNRPLAGKKLYEVLLESFCYHFKNKKDVIKEKEGVLNLIDRHRAVVDNMPPDAERKHHFDLWQKQLDREMQVCIVQEMIDFLSQPRQMPILKELFEYSLFGACRLPNLASGAGEEAVGLRRPRTSVETDMQSKLIMENIHFIVNSRDGEYVRVFNTALNGVISTLCYVDWAGQYEKYHNEDLAKGKAIA